MIDPMQIGEGELTEEQLIYKENIIDHYRNPHNKRVIEEATATYKDLNPLCGDTIQAFLLIENGVIKDISFTGKGCAISQASMSMLTDELKGKATQDVARLSRDYITGMLNIPIGPVRMKCAMLGLRVTQKAIGGEHA
jgi:nitrogen fixation protein NifU and related proteins